MTGDPVPEKSPFWNTGQPDNSNGSELAVELFTNGRIPMEFDF